MPAIRDRIKLAKKVRINNSNRTSRTLICPVLLLLICTNFTNTNISLFRLIQCDYHYQSVLKKSKSVNAMWSFKKKCRKNIVVVLKIILFLSLSLLADFHSVFRGFKTNKRAELVETIRWWGRSGIGRSTVLIDDNLIYFFFSFSFCLYFFFAFLSLFSSLSFNNFLWSSLSPSYPPSLFLNTFLQHLLQHLSSFLRPLLYTISLPLPPSSLSGRVHCRRERQ